MTKSEKKLIYLVEASRLLSKLIKSELKNRGYEVEVFSTGFDFLKKIVSSSPDCIVADKLTPFIDGIELCKIMKDGSSKSSIPYVLYSAEDEVVDFWSNRIGANAIVSVSHNNMENLLTAVDNLLECKYIDSDTFYDVAIQEKGQDEVSLSDDEKLMSWVVDAMDRSDFYMNMVKNVSDLYAFVKDTNILIEKIFRMMFKLCEYDVIVLILDNKEVFVYKTGHEHIKEEILEDFWNICKTDYEHDAKKMHTITYRDVNITGVVPANEGVIKDRFASYRQYTLFADDKFIGTLHFASGKKKLFNYKIQSSIEFCLPALSFLLEESMYHEKVSNSEQKLRHAFSKFIPEQIIDEIVNSGDEGKQINNNEKRNVVILMCDIRNFTSISEINKPEDVVNFLNTYFTHMVEVVKKYGGTVDKFIGDAIMVLFGAPISYNDNAKRAVQAAIEMYSQLDSIPYGQLKFPEDIKFDIGIGIHYGDVIVGQIGSADKTNYTVIGDTVNLANRLEGLTKLYGAKIIISEAVRNELGDEDENINLLLLDSVKVKGKKESVFIYRVEKNPLPKEFTEAYEKGFKSYNEGAFTIALPYFELAVNALPDDKSARLMLERCEEFSVNKPENWDGAIALTSK